MSKTVQKKKVDLNSELLFLFLAVCLVFVLVLTAFNFNRNSLKTVLGASVEIPPETFVQIKYWTNYVAEHPTYLPGYVEIATLEKSCGNKEAALNAVLKGKGVNPNNAELLLLEKQLK